MTLPIYYYVLGTPLGLLGLFRWGCWLVRRIPAVLYRPVRNDFRLIGNEMGVNPDRDVCHDPGHPLPDGVAELLDIAALRHRDGEADGILAIEAEHRGRRIDIGPLHFRHVGEPHEAAVDREVDGTDRSLGGKTAGHMNKDLVAVRLDRAGGHHCILGLQALHHLGRVKAKSGYPAGGVVVAAGVGADSGGSVLR